MLDLYATIIDYNPQAEETVEFFKIVQNKLHYAAHGHTAAEVIASRAAAQPNMGLTAFAGTRPVKAEVSVAKNYLDELELKKLNTLVSAYFDAAEFRRRITSPTCGADHRHRSGDPGDSTLTTGGLHSDRVLAHTVPR
ncbi:Virulence protein RhuM family protein [Tessaracoccus bendigoensis DSM 12906]|uniref:Virulence protein RhuM family protein n=1 Tax=Tessaracoccus bendigoensis DSM 12906 TaxID=1123357 RepID=A0A1M6J9F3_9ACTN|nr:RhuM family protein [Tessaracoccus bendigoensis]SHJ43280.1 Virulence protein RhuM family protein [Tessaracoccus bendigoensis DSM 12906]